MERKTALETVDLSADDHGAVRALVRVRRFAVAPRARRAVAFARMEPRAVLIQRDGDERRIELPRERSPLLPLLAPVAIYIAARRMFRGRRP